MAKKIRMYYCPACLRKFRPKAVGATGDCPQCGAVVRGGTTRTVARVVTRLRRKRGLEPPSIRRDYGDYLASALWKKIKSRVLERDMQTCQRCGGKAETVHHKSYAREVMDGLCDEELVSLCFSCHEDIEFTQDGDRRVKNGLQKANSKLKVAVGKFREGVAG